MPAKGTALSASRSWCVTLPGDIKGFLAILHEMNDKSRTGKPCMTKRQFVIS